MAQNCIEYQAMTPKERTEYIGQLLHSCMSSSDLFKIGERIIKQAKKSGVLSGVLINPPQPEEDIINSV